MGGGLSLVTLIGRILLYIVTTAANALNRLMLMPEKIETGAFPRLADMASRN